MKELDNVGLNQLVTSIVEDNFANIENKSPILRKRINDDLMDQGIYIINPNTGMPLSDYSMAFLSGEDSALLDAFSTSCMIAGPEKSEEWSKKYNFSYSLYEDVGGFTKLVKESESLTKARI